MVRKTKIKNRKRQLPIQTIVRGPIYRLDTPIVLNSLVQVSGLLDRLDCQDVLSLGLVSKTVHDVCYETICAMPFSIAEPINFTHYKIKDLTVSASYAGDIKWPSTLENLQLMLLSRDEIASFPDSLVHLHIFSVLGGCPPLDNLPRQLQELQLAVGLPPNVTMEELENMDDDDALELESFKHEIQFGQSLDNLPGSLKVLSLLFGINKTVDHLPPTLQHFTAGGCFNSPVDNLPDTLRCLYLGPTFNHPVDHLPPSLRTLCVGDAFNQSVDNLPSRLRAFKVNGIEDYNFNQPVSNLPPKLKVFHPGKRFNQPIENLPDTIEFLELQCDFTRPITKLPSALRHLGFSCCFDHPVYFLPPLLEVLKFGVNFNSTISYFPPALKLLTFYGVPEQDFGDTLPRSLIYLELGTIWPVTPPFQLPPSLQVLHLHAELNEYNYDDVDEFLKILDTKLQNIPNTLQCCIVRLAAKAEEVAKYIIGKKLKQLLPARCEVHFDDVKSCMSPLLYSAGLL